MTGTELDLGHTIIELSGPGDSPGNGQHQVERVLHEQKEAAGRARHSGFAGLSSATRPDCE
jgi:hypothetical protein